MERKTGRIPVMILTILAAGAAYFLRLRQLQTCYDETGRVVAGAGRGPLTWLCLAVAVLAAVYAALLTARKGRHALACRSGAVLVLSLAAAAGLVAGCAAMVLRLESPSDLLLAAGGSVTAICWVITALSRFQGRQLPAPLFMIPALFFAVKLIFDFRGWSQDPMILDYCFDLLASICIMCGCFHLGSFSFGKGARRRTVFFCCCGIIFGAAAIAHGRIRELAMTGGAMLWLAVNLWVLLRQGKAKAKKEEPEMNNE